MKRKFTFLAALALLVFMAPSMVGWGQSYSLYSGSLVEGDYLIVYQGKAMKNTISSNRLQYQEVTVNNDVITTSSDAIVWHIAPSGNYWTIYNAAIAKYAAGNGTKNQATLLTDGTADGSLWTASGSSTYEFVNKKNEAANVNKNLRNNGTYGFACYGTGTGGALSLYKLVETNDPTITASPVEIAYDATSGEIEYTINNPVSGGELTAASAATWITLGTVGDESVAFTCEENEGAERSATVVLTYTYNTDQTVTKNVTVTQTGNPNGPGSLNDPYTVAEARAAIDAGTGVNGVYATGIVSRVISYNANYHSITYWISDDGTENDELEAYGGISGIEGWTFTSMDDIQAGATVVIYGDLKKYNDTYEFDLNNQLVSYTAPVTAIATPTFSPAAGTYTEAQSVTISCETPNVTIYYTTNGNDPDDESTLYEGPITVGESMTIKAIAYDENDNTSAIGTAEYVINLPVPSAPYARVDNASYLTNGAKVVFAARFDGNTDQYYAMTNAASGKPTGVLFTSTTSDGYEVLPDAIVDEESSYYWTVGVTENGYTFTNANGKVIGWTSSTNFAIGGDNTEWTIVRGTAGASAMVPSYEAFNIKNKNTPVRAFALNSSHNFGPYDISSNNNSGTYNFSIDIFVEGATPVATPSITANNVTITYDTDGDEIEYLINNPVDGGSLVASTDSDWLEVGDEAYTSNAGTIEFTCSVNPTAAARTATVTLTYTYNRATVTKNVTVTQEANPNAIDNISDITEAGTYTVRGTVVATSTRGFVLGDGTGYIYYYKGSAVEQSVGDIVTISGEVSAPTNYKVFQYTSGATITAAETSNYQAEDPTALTGAQMDAIVTGSTVILSNYVQYQGVLSISNNYYNITDIDGAVTAIGSISYPTSTDFTSLDGKTVLVKGYYVGVSSNIYYNTMLGTIEEVEVPHEEYAVTVSDLVNINTYLFNGDEMVLEGEGTVNILDGNEVLISLDVAEGYVIESLMVDGNNVTSQIAEDHSYTFNMPTHNVTITATAVEDVPPTPAGDYVRITALDQLTDGSVVVIAARYDEEVTNGYYAMKNTLTSGKATGVQFTSATSGSDEILPASIVSDEDDYYWTVNVTENGYTFTNANGNVIGYGSSTNFVMTGEKTDWTITRETSEETAMVGEYTGFVIRNNTTNNRAFAFNGTAFGAYATTNMTAPGYNFFLDFFVQSETPAGTPLFISGYNGSAFANGGYHLIATPVDGIDPANVTNMTNGNYDLYMFDQSGDDEWVNYRQGNNQFAFTELVAGMGYLYAHDTDITLYFEGDLIEGDSYDVSLVLDTDSEFPGWNLVGNSFTVPASIGDRDYYEMHENGRDLIQTSGAIDPMQGIFVIAETDEEELTFSKTITTGGSKVVMNVTSDRSSLVDRATIRFGEGRQLRKIQLNPDNTKIYITEGNTDYAVVRSSDEAEIPVSFKTAENGTYTINFSTEEVEMEYMHLIDNMTGADVDLLATPSYTFEARTTDYASRFRLVFATTTGVSENSENNFAFYNGGNWVINNMGDATLQVVDMLGHILSSETINGNASISIDQVPGVYMIRLVSGNDVKVQKVIIK